MASSIEILLKAKNETDAAFKAVVKHLQETSEEAKKTNRVLEDLSKDIKGKLDDAIGSLTGRLGPLGSTIAAMGPAGVAAAAGIGAVVAVTTIAAKVVLDAATAAATYGDNLAALADKTGLSTDSLQSLEVAAKLGNSSLESVASGVNKMQKAIVDGSTVFSRLGLNLQELRAMKPEEQFVAVAKAIEGIEDPAKRAVARMEVFRNSGNELAGTLKAAAQGAGELGGALSGQAVEAAAALQDKTDLLRTAWERVQLQFGAAIAQSPELQRGIDELAAALVKFGKDIAAATPEIVDFFNKAVAGVRLAIVAFREFGSLDWLEKVKQAGQEIGMDAQDAAERAQLAARRLAFEKKHLVEEEVRFTGKAEEEKTKKKAEQEAKNQALFEMAVMKQKQIINGWHEEQAKSAVALAFKLADIWNDGAEEYEKATEKEEDARIKAEDAKGEAIARNRARQREAHMELLLQIRDIANATLDLGSLLGGAFGKFLEISGQVTHAVANIKGAIDQIKGGGLLEKLSGGLGIAGTVISVGKGIFDALFGGAKRAREEMEKLRASFVQSQGGMAALQAKAKAAGIALDAMFRAKSAKQLEAAIAGIKKQLDLWAEGQDAIQEAMDKYGISVSEMGPAFAQQELDKQAAEVAKAFGVLAAAGGDVSMIAAKMGDDVLALVAQYQAAGIAIPEALRPVLEAMLKNGQLVDENGEAYSSLEDAGIKFAESMTDAMKGLMDHIEELIRVLARGFNVPVNFSYNNAPGPGGGGRDGLHGGEASGIEFNSGGVGNFGMGTPAMLHGTEAILPLDDRTMAQLGRHIAAAMSAHGGGGSGPVVVHNILELDGDRLDARTSRRMRQRGVRSPAQQRGRSGF